jgi:hypothetical protein
VVRSRRRRRRRKRRKRRRRLPTRDEVGLLGEPTVVRALHDGCRACRSVSDSLASAHGKVSISRV